MSSYVQIIESYWKTMDIFGIIERKLVFFDFSVFKCI